MKIAIDARRMWGQKTGVGVYISNLFRTLRRVDNNNEYILFYKNIEKWKNRNKILSVLIPIYVEFIHKQFILPWLLMFKKVDLLFCPCQPIPVFAPCPTVVTIHDIPNKKDRNVSWVNKIFDIVFYFTINRASHIITISNYSKAEILKQYRISSNKITVIRRSVNTARFNPKKDSKTIVFLKKKYRITKRVVLGVMGSLSSNKNLLGFLQAFDLLPQEIKDKYAPVIVGDETSWSKLYRDFTQLVSKETLDDTIVTGYVKDEDLVNFYKMADVLLFPSLHEGFGLPPLEAMSSGIPVIVSKKCSLPEVVGNAGILVDPCDPQEIRDRLYEVLTNFALRKLLIKKGLERLKQFSHIEEAKKTLQIFTQITKSTREEVI